jgi:hypothetical protein
LDVVDDLGSDAAGISLRDCVGVHVLHELCVAALMDDARAKRHLTIDISITSVQQRLEEGLIPSRDVVGVESAWFVGLGEFPPCGVGIEPSDEEVQPRDADWMGWGTGGILSLSVGKGHVAHVIK